MTFDTGMIVTATEANQNFSKVARMAESKGRVVVFKNNRPKLLVIDLDTEPQIEMSEDEKLEFVAARILKEHKAAFACLSISSEKRRFSPQSYKPFPNFRSRPDVFSRRLQKVKPLYPSLGVTFISIQENVNTAAKTGLEMMPFYNIFNEWYAEQTSKKIRAVWKSKAEHGKRVSATIPYGYKKSPEDREKWLIDEPAAEVVRKIFCLCLAGRGPSQIARDLEREKILTPTAYFNSIGRPASNPVQANPYQWPGDTIKHILGNRQYTGCAVNFKSTTVSYKVHKTIYNPIEEQQIIPNMQEPIVSEELFDRVQELRSHKRRNTKTGRKSLFAGLLFCPDCGAKLHFCASKSLKANQEFYRCANYNSGRGTCDIHYIRNVVLEQIVAEAVGSLADFVRCYEPAFLYLIAKNSDAARQSDIQKLKQTISASERRIKAIDKAIEGLFEANISGKITDERFVKMTANYEKEQKELIEQVAESNKRLQEAEQSKVDLRMLLKGLREYTDIRQLTPELVNTLIQRIEVHSKDKATKNVKVDIYFTAVGLFSIPTEKEMQSIMEEIRQDFKQFNASA